MVTELDMLDYSTQGAFGDGTTWGTDSENPVVVRAGTSIFEDVGVVDALRLIETVPGLVILDVRMPVEFADERISGAINLDFYRDDFEQCISALDRDARYLLYCRSGGRSAFTLETMQRLGFMHVAHMAPGMEGWVDAGLPVVRD
ncbi:MAG: rhodanese-like domain-containing protein [Hyphomonas sp.]|nr:rhodanese-like domain-containing protein [Hyphomonas sp.]